MQYVRSMERRVRRKSHARCEVGENSESRSESYLSLFQFGIPSVSLQTKGDSISFQTPSIEGTIVRRNKPLGNDKHPWKAEVTEGDAGVSDATINGWFNAVYEPAYAGD